MLQCVAAVCCGGYQCVAGGCRVLQCVCQKSYESLQIMAVPSTATFLQHIAIHTATGCCRVLQDVAGCCSVS